MLIDYVKDGRNHSDVNHQLNDDCSTAMNLDRLFFLFNAFFLKFLVPVPSNSTTPVEFNTLGQICQRKLCFGKKKPAV